MKAYINSEISKFAELADQKQLASYINEDLEQLGSHNIAGIGITIEQVREWRDEEQETKNSDK